MQRKTQAYIILLCCSMNPACRADRRGRDGPEPGTEFFAIAPETVTEVLYSSSERKLYAYRWTSTEPFHVAVGQRGARPEQCMGGEGFMRWLRALARVPVTRELKPALDMTKGEWANVQLWDTRPLEPNGLTLRVPTATGEPVVLVFEQRQFIVDVNPVALRSVMPGCAALGVRE